MLARSRHRAYVAAALAFASPFLTRSQALGGDPSGDTRTPPPTPSAALHVYFGMRSVVLEIRAAYEADYSQATTSGTDSVLSGAVDCELNFKSIVIDEKGWALFGKNWTEFQMEIRLATRVTPPGRMEES